MTDAIFYPPFDPELEAVLAVVVEQAPVLTPETIPQLREAVASTNVADEALTAAGVTRRDVTIPWLRG